MKIDFVWNPGRPNHLTKELRDCWTVYNRKKCFKDQFLLMCKTIYVNWTEKLGQSAANPLARVYEVSSSSAAVERCSAKEENDEENNAQDQGAVMLRIREQ